MINSYSMKNIIPSLVILVSAMLFNCQGKTGDPGPIGAPGAAGSNGANGANGAAGPDATAPYVNGALSGNITGTRADGTTPINETFSYTYDPGYYTLSANVGQVQTVSLLRYQSLLSTANSFLLPLILNGSGQYFDSLGNSSFSLSYTKALAGNQLFKLSVQPVLTKQVVILPVDPANTSYQFDFSFIFGGPNVNYIQPMYDNNGHTGFNTKLGEQVFFDSPYAGGAFVKIIDAQGVTSTTSATYGNLILNQSTAPNGFFFTLGGNDLSKTVTLPADKYTITGYSYDTTTSDMKFDYTINIGGYPKPNSTRHPMTITGSFTGKVSQIVNGAIKGNDGHVSH
jgi:hypothetical protein